MTTSPAPPPWYGNPQARAHRCVAVPVDRIRAFHRQLPGYATTPLVALPTLAGELGVAHLYVKDESHRMGLPAFKVLGASWAVAATLAAHLGMDEVPDLADLRGALEHEVVRLVTATDGNHGRAVARMASLVDVPATVFVPPTVPGPAVAAIRAEGATVEVVDVDYDHAVRTAADFVAQDATAVLVQDTAWPGYEDVPSRIVDGYSTLLAEVDDQLVAQGVGPPGLVVVPVGVGSLAQSVVAHHRRHGIDRAAAVLAVEPDTAACVLASLHAGQARTVATGSTVMAGLNCGTPSSLAWPVLRDGLDAAVAIPDVAATQAVADLGGLGVSSGPSGAASLAGLRAVLQGPGRATRRDALGVDGESVVVLLNTEGADAVASPAVAAG